MARFSRVKNREVAAATASTAASTASTAAATPSTIALTSPDDNVCLQMDYGTQVNFPEIDKSPKTFIFECNFISGNQKSTGVSSCQQISSMRNAKVQTETKETKSAESNTDIFENNQSCALPFIRFNDRQFRSFCGVSKQYFSFLVFKVSPAL